MLTTLTNSKKDKGSQMVKTDGRSENKAQLLKIVDNLKNKHNFDASVGELYNYIDKNPSINKKKKFLNSKLSNFLHIKRPFLIFRH